MVLINRDNQGKASLQMRWIDADDVSYHRLASSFAEALFGASREVRQPDLARAGLDPLFCEQVDRAVKPGGAACLIYVPKESRIDGRRYYQILEAGPGEVYRTTFQSIVEEVLLKQDE